MCEGHVERFCEMLSTKFYDNSNCVILNFDALLTLCFPADKYRTSSEVSRRARPGRDSSHPRASGRKPGLEGGNARTGFY